MRGFLASLLFAIALLCVMWIAGSHAVRDARMPSVAASPPLTANADSWRRTVNGWERMSDWPAGPQAVSSDERTLRVHPLVVGALELFLSLAALMAWPYSRLDAVVQPT